MERKVVVKKLQSQIDAIQGLGRPLLGSPDASVLPFATAFPGNVFPMNAIHEFISHEPSEAAATNGFITALAANFIKDNGICLWIESERKIFPSGLKYFGLEPDRIVFINVVKQKDALWVIEEALKCDALTVVVGEIRELGFTESRRLQLAVERSGATGFIHRYRPRFENSLACTTRWKITPLTSITNDDLPGMGTNCWDIQLLKVRNGKPGSWKLGWLAGRFQPATQYFSAVSLSERHAG